MRQVDNYAIETFRNCPHSHYWRIQRKLVLRSDKKVAAEFGVAFHLALDTYYGSGMQQSSIDNAIIKGVEYFRPFQIEGDDKRTEIRLATILDKYFQRYKVEPFNVIATEVGGAFELNSEWMYTSRLDLLAEWSTPRGVYIVDHKTTYDLNSLIAKPHNQLTGYIYTASEMYENVLGGIINGIGTYATDVVMDKTLPKVASEKTGKPVYQQKEREFFSRITTQRTPSELEEWKMETLWYLHQIEECEEKGVWPKHSPDHCVKYKGRCPYLDLCNATPDVAERMIEMGVYEVKEWQAYPINGDSEANAE